MKVQHLSKIIHNKEILKDIEFEVETGNIIGIVGRNGAGKTTLLRTMAGILSPTKGDVLVEDKSIFEQHKLKEQILFVPDSSEALKNYSTKEILKLYKAIYPNFDTDYFHALMGKFALPQVSKIGTYSKGMKALFSIIIAFATKAHYILLDEPTDGLDVIVKKQVLQLLVEEVADKERSVIISSHRLDELEFMANDIIMIKDGRVDTHYELDALKSQYIKAQVVFEADMPDELHEHVTIVAQTGRVYTILLDRQNEVASNAIHSHSPLLFEELSLSLEDIFVAKLGGESDV
ncbi:ABC transporter ATP-binding protein [Paenalkalicoccus suaedae]|uniref:ABC transporter ATP-binding protein n=1 Tax=Paenalkalicoccus suaedae TaxID=2592382 RepID=A0A859FCB8_9BACI|nr:ABC transporter ATP-binding protein [Paenalkalicoccus suaedae]QKS70707.1 ABC transporter ATP-binding protein [Paenalkalicoccus suaedae]